MLKEMKAENVKVPGDSQLTVNQLARENRCMSFALALYYVAAMQLLDDFDGVTLEYVPGDENYEADKMA